jgi:hypothetical protein
VQCSSKIQRNESLLDPRRRLRHRAVMNFNLCAKLGDKMPKGVDYEEEFINERVHKMHFVNVNGSITWSYYVFSGVV